VLRLLAPALLAAVVVIGPPGCSEESGPPNYRGKRPVILISIDSLRADHCTPYGYTPAAGAAEPTTPFLARAAQAGVLFENASAASPWTLPSHITLLTGMHPREHGVRSRKYRVGDDLELVSGKFRDAGYRTAGFFSGPFLHPVWGFGHGFDVYQPGAAYLADPDNSKALAEAGKSEQVEEIHSQSHLDKECAAQVVGKGLNWLKKDERWREPFFLFLHLWDPHYDYFPPADYRGRFLPGDDGSVKGDELLRTEVPFADGLKLSLLALYDAEIRYTDDWMARLDAQLQEWGIADDVILLITADHGEEFMEHGNRGHHLTLYEEVMHVPMVLRAPGLAPAGARVQGSVSLADVAPTLLDLAGVGGWPERSGRSMRLLWETGAGDHDVRMDLLRPTQKIHLLGWREGGSKLIFDANSGEASVFDLLADARERQPALHGIRDANPVVQRARRAFETEPQTPPHPPQDVSESEHLNQVLSQVGYGADE